MQEQQEKQELQAKNILLNVCFLLEVPVYKNIYILFNQHFNLFI